MSEREATTEPTVDVVGIGNALVDVLSHESYEFIEAQGLTPGSMSLIDEERRAALYAAMGPAIEVSGGSAANTMVGLASFGGTAHYISRVRDDQFGSVYAHDLNSIGVAFTTPFSTDGPPTGCCLVLITEDGQRTMNTYLGASSMFGAAEVDPEVIRSGRVLYLEGYLFDSDEAKSAFVYASQVAREAGRTVALTLSDAFCVDRHRDAFRTLLDEHVDLLFANEAEICALYEVDDIDGALAEVRRECDIAVITRGADGAVIINGDRTVTVSAEPVERVVDTTGAGDLYAAGFLYGHARGLDLEVCGRLGAIAAAEIISHVGPRPETSLADLAERYL